MSTRRHRLDFQFQATGFDRLETREVLSRAAFAHPHLLHFFHLQAATPVAAVVPPKATTPVVATGLRPLAGNFTFLLFALGIIGTGMLAIPVLAGSAAYGVSEVFGWPATLEAQPRQAIGFYAIIAGATIIGFGLGFTGFDAIHMLIWSAVLNGIVAVPIMAMMMIIVSSEMLMGRFKANRWLVWLGWTGTGLMALAVIAMLWSFTM